jgi:hypothetical protein
MTQSPGPQQKIYHTQQYRMLLLLLLLLLLHNIITRSP